MALFSGFPLGMFALRYKPWQPGYHSSVHIATEPCVNTYSL